MTAVIVIIGLELVSHVGVVHLATIIMVIAVTTTISHGPNSQSNRHYHRRSSDHNA